MVVFPNVTLTIEPGVVVKFDAGKRLEIRQAKLTAIGNVTDSISFISVSGTLPGSWGEIFINNGNPIDTVCLEYCNVKYAVNGVRFDSEQYLKIRHCNFFSNNKGVLANHNTGPSDFYIDSSCFVNNIYAGIDADISHGERFVLNTKITYSQNGMLGRASGLSEIKNCIIQNNLTGLILFGYNITNCDITDNQTGLNGGINTVQFCTISNNSSVGLYEAGDSIVNCLISNNGIGFRDWGGQYDRSVLTLNTIENNTIGVKIEGVNSNGSTRLYCNRICDNSMYNLYYNATFTTTINFNNNYWCLTDSLLIANSIYDGYDNINLGLTNFIPLDTTQCYRNNISIGFADLAAPELFFEIFPNPASGYINILTSESLINPKLIVTDLTGRVVAKTQLVTSNTQLSTEALPNGLYFITVKSGPSISTRRLVIQK